MPNATPAQHRFTQWQLPALALAVLVIVVAPFLLMRDAGRDAAEAWQRVIHTRDVEARMHALSSDMRSLESGALALASGIDTARLRERAAAKRTRIAPAMLDMQRLTQDNPEQQLRLGALQSNITLRLERIDRLLASGSSDRADLEAIVTQYPIQELIEEIITAEQALLAERLTRAERVSQRSQYTTWGAMLAQLLLLGGLLLLAWRQVASRLNAERHATLASGRASAVLDTVREPIVLVDAGLRVVMHNVAFAELYGVDTDVRGTLLADIGGGAWRDESMLRRLADVLGRNRELWDLEHRQRTTDGVDRMMLVNARSMPLPDRDDRVALVTASDVSAQKASERQIRDLARQLEGKVEQISDVNRELEAFSYSVSHDLRAPLRHIAGFSEKLGRHLGESVDDKSRHYLDVIGGSARRMSALIDDLLVYSRLGRSAIRLQMVDLQSMVEDTRSLLESNAHAEAPGRRIEWSIAPLPVVVADENMLRQVWLNLLGNAVKYSRDADPARIQVQVERTEDGGYHFQVRDNGAGFDMQYAGKLFGVFQRLHSASEFPGTGIGLASVRRVLTRHGGRIWAESTPGQGATFHFTLPNSGDINATTESST